MADCIWVQYEPAGSVTPYEGFINATVRGDDQKPPPIGANRKQANFPPDAKLDGMQIDVSAQKPALIAALPQNIPPEAADPVQAQIDALTARIAAVEAKLG